jgi:hypothetical protein
VVAVLKDDVLAQIEAPTRRDDPEAERRRRAEMLVAALDGDRERLFELQSLFLLRLHRASDDFGATEGLRVVESAIAMITQEGVLSAH